MARKQFLLRIDPELWKELERWAADELRSVNAQIEWLLREAVRQRRGSRPQADSVDEVDDDAGDGVGGVQPDAADALVKRRP